MDYTQSMPFWFVLTTLTLDLVGVFMNISVLVGILRAFSNNKSHLIQYCSTVQLISTLSISVFVIVGKIDLLCSNWSIGAFFYDKSNIASSQSVIAQYFCSSLLILTMLPIYCTGLAQLLCIDSLLKVKETWVRRTVIKHPGLYFSASYIPGIVCLVGYWFEMHYRNIETPFSINGAVIAPFNSSYFTIGSYFASLWVTFGALYYSIKCFMVIKANIRVSMATIKKTGIPGYLVFQVLYMGYALPIAGICKLPEILIWLFPSSINLTYGYISLISTSIHDVF
jgi:hypothetical protein